MKHTHRHAMIIEKDENPLEQVRPDDPRMKPFYETLYKHGVVNERYRTIRPVKIRSGFSKESSEAILDFTKPITWVRWIEAEWDDGQPDPAEEARKRKEEKDHETQ